MKEKKRGPDRRKTHNTVTFPLRLPGSEKIIGIDRRSNTNRRHNEFISQQHLFSNISYDLAESLSALCTNINLSPDDILLEPDQSNNNLYLLLEGLLKVHIETKDSEEGFLIQPGEFIGEISVIDGNPPSAYVISKQQSRVLAIPDFVLWEHFFKNATIARNFMRMFAHRLRDRNQHIQRALEQQLCLKHLQKELSIARNIQASMLPSETSLCKHFPNIDVETSMIPANEVGGDFYDAFPLDKNHICLSIGDVSGKGIPASLFMVKTLTLLREEVIRYRELPLAVSQLNKKLCQDNSSCMFATLIVGILDINQGCFSFINAGHNQPLLFASDMSSEFVASPKGILVGINEYAQYQITELQLNKNDTLILYTDGVTEAMNSEGEVFSDYRFKNLLSLQDMSSARNVVQKINNSVKEFAGNAPQSDDLTLSVLRYT